MRKAEDDVLSQGTVDDEQVLGECDYIVLGHVRVPLLQLITKNNGVDGNFTIFRRIQAKDGLPETPNCLESPQLAKTAVLDVQQDSEPGPGHIDQAQQQNDPHRQVNWPHHIGQDGYAPSGANEEIQVHSRPRFRRVALEG